MVEIVIFTCLLSDPGVCRDQAIPLLEETSAVRCMMNAPPHLAKWSEEHPQWRVMRWQCRTGARREI
jgi:hypothetical protein